MQTPLYLRPICEPDAYSISEGRPELPSGLQFPTVSTVAECATATSYWRMQSTNTGRQGSEFP
jgi:hypothetical protein